MIHVKYCLWKTVNQHLLWQQLQVACEVFFSRSAASSRSVASTDKFEQFHVLLAVHRNKRQSMNSMCLAVWHALAADGEKIVQVMCVRLRMLEWCARSLEVFSMYTENWSVACIVRLICLRSWFWRCFLCVCFLSLSMLCGVRLTRVTNGE